MPQLKKPPPLKLIVLQSLQTLGQDLLREVCSGIPGVIPSTRSGMSFYLVEDRNHKFLQSGLPQPLSNTLISQAKCTYGDDRCREINLCHTSLVDNTCGFITVAVDYYRDTAQEFGKISTSGPRSPLSSSMKCTRLQYLNVISSVEMIDICVTSVLQIKNLKVINMCNVSPTADGYTSQQVSML